WRSPRRWSSTCCANAVRATRSPRPTRSCRVRSTPTSTEACCRSSASTQATSSSSPEAAAEAASAASSGS
ncbi:MAG: hypothetical protein AVDCRST_MAG65-2156, partial [uncultured Solirubrobacteraceae bacterium]